MTDPVKCPDCGQTGTHAERCPRVANLPDCCPECGAKLGTPHAERCPLQFASTKTPDDRSKLEKTVEQWAADLASEIPKPRVEGWKTRLPMETTSKQRIVTPDGHGLGIASQIGTEISGPELLWREKLAKEPCLSCQSYSRDLFEEKDRAELALFLQREAKWDANAIKLVMDDPTQFGVCLAHSMDKDNLHITHARASCLHLYKPKKEGWLQSVGGKIFGGSKRFGM